MKHILIIDDDIHIGNTIEESLVREGYRVSRAYSGTEALYALSKDRPDLVLLDLMLPGLSGEEVLPKIQGVPVIVVSAKIDVQDKVELLLGGAADYITKPFEMKELLARITVALRSGAAPADPVLSFGELRLDTMTRRVFAGEQEAALTRTEFAILKILLQNPGQVIAKSLLLERMAQDTPDCTEGSLKIHISHLRKKLRETVGKDYIESVWGIGFRLNAGS